MPYQIVAKYRNNEIKPVLFPSVIFQVAKEYNNPYILVEVNDIGDSIAATLNYDLEYPNVLMCAMRGRAGQVVGQGFSCLLYTSPSPRDVEESRMPSSA